MASNSPPSDAPPPDEQDAATVSAGFEAGPPVASLCGFSLPSFIPKISLHLLSISFPPSLPGFKPAIGLNCSLSNPIHVTAGLSSGGGRQSTGEPDEDDSAYLSGN